MLCYIKLQPEYICYFDYQYIYWHIDGPGINPNPVPAGNMTEISATVWDNYKLASSNPVGIMIYNNTTNIKIYNFYMKFVAFLTNSLFN